MIGLAIVLLLIMAYFVSTTDIVKAYEESEKIIHLEAKQTPEQEAAVEALKEQWIADFNRLLNESNNEKHPGD
jgi:hypothetical protein